MIELKSLKKTFRKTPILRGINLELGHGDRMALVGSNGAGKTTLIRCLLGQYTFEGEVLINDLSPRKRRRDVLKRIGFVPQLPPPLKMSVSQLIHFAADLCNADPEQMFSVARKLGLRISEVRNRIFVKLSGGEKQKLLIGIALGRDTDLLILDEPAANLDPEARQVFFNLLAERLNRVSMIISSHRLDEVAALVNRVVELDLGQIVLDDHVDDVVDLNSILNCTINLSQDNEAFAKTIDEWGFTQTNGQWQGQVAGPDRLRFLGVLSRYAGLIKGIEMKEDDNEHNT
ncbi:MAG: ATP-binding cassette domain-containing protein [Candidatus Marinimicrobia bacterium]|nr:ATP-binding cassette domain-containing protein [Candidatus Neomarinimicrobiota bacterium]